LNNCSVLNILEVLVTVLTQTAFVLVFKVRHFQKAWKSRREQHTYFTRLYFTMTHARTSKLTEDYFAYSTPPPPSE